MKNLLVTSIAILLTAFLGVAREGHQMKPEASAVAYNVLGVTLALGDDLVFPLELHSGFAEGFFVVYFAVAGLAAQLQIPVLGEVPSQHRNHDLHRVIW